MNESSLLLFEWVMMLMAIALVLGFVGSSSKMLGNCDSMSSPRQLRSQKSCNAVTSIDTLSNSCPRSPCQSQYPTATLEHGSVSVSNPSSRQTQATASKPQSVSSTDKDALFRLQQRYQLMKQELEHQEARLQEEFQEKTFHQLQSLLVSFPTALQATHHQPDLPARNLRPLFSSLHSLLNTWGYEAIASPWEQVEFDPQIHQPDEDDIAVGEKVYVRFVGYRTGDRILCPAKVSRSLPQLLQQS